MRESLDLSRVPVYVSGSSYWGTLLCVRTLGNEVCLKINTNSMFAVFYVPQFFSANIECSSFTHCAP